MGFFGTNVLQADTLYIVHVQWTEWYRWGGGGGLVSNAHTISSLIARPCLTLSTRLKQQKRTAFEGNYNYFFTIRKFALYVSYAQINQPFIKIIFYIVQMYTTRVWRKLFKAGSVTRAGGVSVARRLA